MLLMFTMAAGPFRGHLLRHEHRRWRRPRASALIDNHLLYPPYTLYETQDDDGPSTVSSPCSKEENSRSREIKGTKLNSALKTLIM